MKLLFLLDYIYNCIIINLCFNIFEDAKRDKDPKSDKCFVNNMRRI